MHEIVYRSDDIPVAAEVAYSEHKFTLTLQWIRQSMDMISIFHILIFIDYEDSVLLSFTMKHWWQVLNLQINT